MRRLRANEVTISRTWRESVEVNTFTNSGIIAPASVPQLMTVDELPPQRRIAASVGNHQVADDVGQHDGNDRRQPDQAWSAALRNSSCRRCRTWPLAIASLMK